MYPDITGMGADRIHAELERIAADRAQVRSDYYRSGRLWLAELRRRANELNRQEERLRLELQRRTQTTLPI